VLTLDSARPSVRVEIKNRPRGSNTFEFNLTMTRTFIPNDPLLCTQPDPMQAPATVLTTRFRIAGGRSQHGQRLHSSQVRQDTERGPAHRGSR
jgi:hypothetical protein